MMMRWKQGLSILVLPVASSASFVRTHQTFGLAKRKLTSRDRGSSRLLAGYQPALPNFCSDCGSSRMVLKVPDGDDHVRAVCGDCDAVVYSNPKVVVACVVYVTDNNSGSNKKKKVLLAKRAIEPRAGYWGIPQGYMELDETSREAACREVREETGADILPQNLRFRALYNVPGSVQLVYSASVESEGDLTIAGTTSESTAIGFFDEDSLPELCFPTVQWALDHCLSEKNSDDIQQKNKLYDPATGRWSESEDEQVTALT